MSGAGSGYELPSAATSACPSGVSRWPAARDRQGVQQRRSGGLAAVAGRTLQIRAPRQQPGRVLGAPGSCKCVVAIVAKMRGASPARTNVTDVGATGALGAQVARQRGKAPVHDWVPPGGAACKQHSGAGRPGAGGCPLQQQRCAREHVAMPSARVWRYGAASGERQEAGRAASHGVERRPVGGGIRGSGGQGRELQHRRRVQVTVGSHKLAVSGLQHGCAQAGRRREAGIRRAWVSRWRLKCTRAEPPEELCGAWV